MVFTTENQKRADERLPILLDLPFKHKGIMCAPMISEITLDKYLSTGKFEIVLVDGENYEGNRPLIYKEKNIKIQPRCKTCKRRFSCIRNIFKKKTYQSYLISFTSYAGSYKPVMVSQVKDLIFSVFSEYFYRIYNILL